MKPQHSDSNGKRRPTTRHLLQLCGLALFLAMIGAGCKQEAKVAADSDRKATADANIAGTYTLVSVDGNKVPGAVQHEGHTMTINSGSFTINSDGTCGSKMVLAGRDSAIEVKASYTRQGSKLTMRWAGAGMTMGTVEGTLFTMTNEGMVLAYRK